jgi:tetratricopeptide (TPR) repeat protein
MRVIRLALLSLLALALPLAAQQKAPRRPKLPAGADTNSALAYYRFGLATLESDARKASEALYWANRLNPGWAAALYAQRVATLRSDERRLIRYINGDRSAIRDFAPVDSLYLRALLVDPFLHTDLDRDLLRNYFVAYYSDQVSRSGASSRDPQVQLLIEHEIRNLMGSEAGVGYQAWEAFSDGRFHDAIALYGKLLARKKKDAATREDLGTALFLARDFGKAAVELKLAIEERDEKDQKQTVFLYRSKALLQHKLGLALTRKGDLDAAREAFGKALAEDLSFYPAHLVLAHMAMASGDTATAFLEYQTAVELRPEEVTPHLTRASALMSAGRYDAAIESLTKLTTLEPYFAEPFYNLGRALEAKGDGAAAIVQYNAFLAKATSGDANRATAIERIKVLGGTPVAAR